MESKQRNEHLLDHFPLDEKELEVLLTLERCPEIFQNPLLQRIFNQAKELVFSSCNDEASQFLEAIVSLCGRRDEAFIWRILDIAADETSVQELIDLYCEPNADMSPRLVFHPIKGLGDTDKEQKVDKIEWVKAALPRLPAVVAVVFARAVGLKSTAAAPLLPTAKGIEAPLWHPSSSSSVKLQLSLMDLGGTWRPIYRSDDDGLSFHTFSSALIGFAGATVTLIQTTSNELIGYYTEVPWKTSTKWFTGEGTSVLFRLQPDWSIYLPQFRGSTIPKPFHQYLHLPHMSPIRKEIEGLAIGGIADNLPRLHIPPSMEGCKACEVGSVFESGPLLSNSELFFDVQAIEVWSVREDYAAGKLAGQKQTEVRESLRQRVARVDKAEFVDHLVQHSSLFAHRQSDRPDSVAVDFPDSR